MSVFEELRAIVASIENSTNLMSKEKDPSVSDEKYQEDLSTAVFEAYASCLELQDNAKAICATLRKSYKVKDAEVKKWIKENEEPEPEPTPKEEPKPSKPEPKKRGRKPKSKVEEPTA